MNWMPHKPPQPITGNHLQVRLAARKKEIKAAQKLRFQIFSEEMGAHLPGGKRIDKDHFDSYCYHLIVIDPRRDNEVIACTRILTDQRAKSAGGYYSAHEFDLDNITCLPGRIMEVGRTCVHHEYRNGSAIGVLWTGLAQFMIDEGFDYLIGCASIPLGHSTHNIGALYKYLHQHHLCAEHQRVTPHLDVPAAYMQISAPTNATLPPLLKAYMRLGAEVCGAPCWDPEFNVADVFVLLDRKKLNARYARHFIGKASLPALHPPQLGLYAVAGMKTRGLWRIVRNKLPGTKTAKSLAGN